MRVIFVPFCVNIGAAVVRAMSGRRHRCDAPAGERVVRWAPLLQLRDLVYVRADRSCVILHIHIGVVIVASVLIGTVSSVSIRLDPTQCR